MAFWWPRSNHRRHIVFVLSVRLSVCLFVCLSVVNFNLHNNFWTFRNWVFIFGMHAPLKMPYQMTPRSMTLCPWIWPSKNSFFGLCCHRGHSVSQMHVFFLFCIFFYDSIFGVETFVLILSQTPYFSLDDIRVFFFSFQLWHQTNTCWCLRKHTQLPGF